MGSIFVCVCAYMRKGKCVVVYLYQSLLFTFCVGFVNLLVEMIVGAFAVLLCHKC